MTALRHRPWLGTAIGVLVSGAFLALALRGVDTAAIARVLRDAAAWMALPFLASLFCYYWVKTVRWADLLSPVRRVSAGELFAPVMIGYAGSALLPLQLGEVARAYLAAQRLRVPAFAVLISIALERVLDLLSILALLAVALVTGDQLPPRLATAGWLMAFTTLAVGSVLAAYLFHTAAFVRLTRLLTRRLAPRLGERLAQHVEAGADGLQALRSARLLARLATTSLLQWLFMWLCVWLSLAAVGVEVPPAATFVTLVFMVIGISLPNSPGYIGSIQLAYVLALQPFGVAAADAIAASVFFHVLAYVSVIVAGAVFAQRLGIGWRALARRAA